MYSIFMVVFMALLFGYGISFVRNVSDSASFMTANANLPWYVNAGTLTVTYVGAGALIGGAALAFKSGYNAIWLYAGGWVAIVILSFFADRIKKTGATTTAELISFRYGEKARLAAAFVVILAEICVVAYNIKSTAFIINVTTGMDVKIATMLGTAVIIGFTITAGLLSVAYTDFVQSLIIVISLIVSIPFMLSSGGGIGAIVDTLPQEFFHPIDSFSWVQMLSTGLPTLCMVFMAQSMWQRFSASRSDKELRLTIVVWLIGVVFICFLIMSFAMIGKALLPTATGDTIVMAASKELLPTVLGLCMLAACCSILLSTADSYLLASGTVFVNDFYCSFINKNLTEKQKITVLRITILVLGLLAYIMINFFPSVLSMVFFTYTMEGCLIVVALGAFFWKRATPQGGFASIMAMCITIILWEIFKPYGVATIFPALAIGTIILIVVSLMTPAPNPKYLERFQR